MALAYSIHIMADLENILENYLTGKSAKGGAPQLTPYDIYPIAKDNPDLTLKQVAVLHNRAFGFDANINAHEISHALYALALGHMGYKEVLANGTTATELHAKTLEFGITAPVLPASVEQSLISKHESAVYDHAYASNHVTGDRIVLALAATALPGTEFEHVRIGKFHGGIAGYYPALRERFGLNKSGTSTHPVFESSEGRQYGVIDGAWVMPEGVQPFEGFKPSFLMDIYNLLSPAIACIRAERRRGGRMFNIPMREAFPQMYAAGPPRPAMQERAMYIGCAHA
jgi:hypothetical protein